MIVFPNCKINLGLNVVAKRSDGFHDLETVFYPLPLHDVLEIVPAQNGTNSFQSTGLAIPGDPEDNICLKAVKLLNKDYQVPAVNIHLHKVIPMGAGLGGGSSDGTSSLKLLNEMFSLGLDQERLQDYARQLGSDCAFFVVNRPVFGYGKGDRFLPLALDLSRFKIVLAIPPYHINTARAYEVIKPAVPAKSARTITEMAVEEWRNFFVNDFETSVFAKYPEIAEIKKRLYGLGAAYASMTGSGSAVYGLFRNEPPIKDAFPGCAVYVL